MSISKYGFRFDSMAAMMGLCSLLMITACSAPKFTPIEEIGNLPSENPTSPTEPPPTGPTYFKVSESFEQDSGANKVDILIINDNSRSMYLEQTKMGEKFSSFISHLQGIDYQIGMTTTDSNLIAKGTFGRLLDWNGTGSYILKDSSTSAAEAFKTTLPRPETLSCGESWTNCASADEQALLAMLYAYGHKDGLNDGFFRNNTDLAVVVLSDEDEMSTGAPEATKAKDVVKFFEKAFKDRNRNFSVHGLVIVPGDDACLEEQRSQASSRTGSFGTHVAELASLTGGVLASICAADYGDQMAEISKRVRGLVNSYQLKHKPHGDKLKIKLVPHADVQYRLEGKKLIFDPAPPAGTKVEIDYEYE